MHPIFYEGPQVGDVNSTNFTEKDIKETARFFSGYKNDVKFTNIDSETNILTGKIELNGVRAILHNADAKAFSSAFQNMVVAPSATDGCYATATACHKFTLL